MIYKRGKEINIIRKGGRDIVSVFRMTAGVWRSVWEAVRSCFGAGRWEDGKMWSDDDPWAE